MIAVIPNLYQIKIIFMKGIEYLIENEILQDNAESIAQFLYKGEGLSKAAIGDYLGERYISLQSLADIFL